MTYKQYKIIKGEKNCQCVTLNGRRNYHLVAGDMWLELNELFEICKYCPIQVGEPKSIKSINDLPVERINYEL